MPFVDPQPSFDDLVKMDEYDRLEEQKDAAKRKAREQRSISFLAREAHELNNAELLSGVTGMTFEEASEVLGKAGDLFELARKPTHYLLTLPHITAKRAAIIRAMTEWALRLTKADVDDRPQIRTPVDAANLLMLEMGVLEREELRVIGLDTKNRVKFVETIYKGSLNAMMVRVAEVFQRSITEHCASIILAHNHPSGDPTPSLEDARATEEIRKGGELLGIHVWDHVVIGRNRFVSMKDRGLGFG